MLRLPYKTVDGVQIPTDIFLPSSTQIKKDKCPVLLMIHGGGFIVGSSKMCSRDQIEDCLERGWIVLAIEHRLCPGVDVLHGAMVDVRDCYQWVQNGGLRESLVVEKSEVKPDEERILAMGTSAGGHLALTLVSRAGTKTIQSHDSLQDPGIQYPKSTSCHTGLLRCKSI